MSYFSDFGAAAFGSLASNVQADIDSERGLKEREKLMEIEEKLRKKAEESRVAAKRMFLQPGGVGPQGPEPKRVMVEEFNNQGRPISSRPAGPGESEEYTQTQEVLAANKAAEAAKANRQNLLDNSVIAYRQAATGAAQTRQQLDADKRANPERYKSNAAAPSVRAPDYDQMIDNANKILGAIEDPTIKTQLQAEISEAIAKLKPNPDGTPGVDSAVAAQMLKIAIRNAREMEAMKGGKKPKNSAEPSAAVAKFEVK